MRNLILLWIGLLALIAGGCETKPASIGMAVEFNAHSACAYISQDKGWFGEEGLELAPYESYVTGMALAVSFGPR